MSLSQAEFDALLEDTGKTIEEDISWVEDEDHSPSVEFRVEVKNEAGYPLFLRGSYNPDARTLSFALIHRKFGRIYGLCFGKGHHNPDCTDIGDIHKHRWNEQFRDKEAYEPEDIKALELDPVTIWPKFCEEARINHKGSFNKPPSRQEGLFK